jgi:hypothetical protein
MDIRKIKQPLLTRSKEYTKRLEHGGFTFGAVWCAIQPASITERLNRLYGCIFIYSKEPTGRQEFYSDELRR